MGRNIVIGADLEPVFNSRALWEWADISENSMFYKLRHKDLDFTVYVFKKSVEGIELKEWIKKEENRNNDAVHRRFFEYLLPNLTYEDFFAIMDYKVSSAWNDGYRKAQYDIRKALGVRD